MEKGAHSASGESLLSFLKTSKNGLSSKEANERLAKHGLNELVSKKEVSPLKIFLAQFNSILIWILFAAVLISLVVGEYLDSIAILVILILNAFLGFFQEYRAEKAIESLKKLAALRCKVIRYGTEIEIDSKYVVPGDIMLLEEGVKIAADGRILESFSFNTQEAPLTGESTPIKKIPDTLAPNTQLADRKNMVYSGTIATKGRAIALVVATGMNTEIGKIATLIEEIEPEKTPLQKKLASLGRVLGIATVIIAFIVLISGLLRGIGIVEMFITAIALAVAAIPEGLPAVVTISLAMGVQRMIKKNALVRKLPSVETLGSTTVICSDKTGTLTLNEMTVKKVFVDMNKIQVDGNNLNGTFSKDSRDLNLLLSIGVLCNNAVIHDGKPLGDPTEVALLFSGLKNKLEKERLLAEFEKIGEIPFSSEAKYMVTMHKTKAGEISYMKGAPDTVLEKCNRILVNGRARKLYPKDKEDIQDEINNFAENALRVLGFAYKETSNLDELDSGFVFVGLQGMIDPPRSEVKVAIDKCNSAGIKTVMITGDHKLTAMAIARELGMEGKAITGEELDKIDDLDAVVNDIAVYARVNPTHKLRIMKSLKKRGHIVAMTGDGVNDAPALKESDIGIAMGITGTDVAKEASHMVLTDDNFASIVNAVEEGRSIYDNIKKFVAYLLSCNLGEVLVIFIASLLGWPLPLIAIQLLWTNIITDGLPALALGLDPASKDIMSRKPRNPKSKILSKNMFLKISILGILVTIGTLYLFRKFLNEDLITAQTMAFTSLVLIEMCMVFIVRFSYHPGFLSNKKLLLAVASSILLHLGIIYTPLNKIFNVVPLGILHWQYLLMVMGIIVIFGLIIDSLMQKITKEYD